MENGFGYSSLRYSASELSNQEAEYDRDFIGGAA